MKKLKILMTTFLLILSLIGSVFAFTFSFDIEPTIDFTEEDEKVLNYIEGTSVSIFSLGDCSISNCSGVIIEEDERNSYVLTAKHCIDTTEEVYVDNSKVDLIIAPINEDLAVLIVKGKLKNKYPIKIANISPKLEDIIYHIGYPDFDIYKSKGTIFKYTDDWGWAKIKVKPGCSGGGMFNKDGELIGIVWGTLFGETPISIYEPLEDIKSFLNIIETIDN